MTQGKPLLPDTPTHKRAAAYQALLMDRYRLEVAHQFGIHVQEYRIIVAEGIKKGW